MGESEPHHGDLVSPATVPESDDARVRTGVSCVQSIVARASQEGGEVNGCASQRVKSCATNRSSADSTASKRFQLQEKGDAEWRGVGAHAESSGQQRARCEADSKRGLVDGLGGKSEPVFLPPDS